MDDGKVIDRSEEYNWLNDRERLFNDSTWNLDRCTSYKFTIFDSFGDGFSMSGYAKVTLDGAKGGTEILGRVDGDFGTESSIDIYVCEEKNNHNSCSIKHLEFVTPHTQSFHWY